jgi:sialic acid synthase SpsE
MSDMAQVFAAKRCVETVWQAKGIAQELAILHCVSSYPAPPGLSATGVSFTMASAGKHSA